MSNVRSEKIFASAVGSKARPVLELHATTIVGEIKDDKGNEVYAKIDHNHDEVYVKKGDLDKQLEGLGTGAEVDGKIADHDAAATAHKALFDAKADKTAVDEMKKDLDDLKNTAGDAKLKDLQDHEESKIAHKALFDEKADVDHNHDDKYADKTEFGTVKTDVGTLKTDLEELKKTAGDASKKDLEDHEASAEAHKDLFDAKADKDHNHDEVYVKLSDVDKTISDKIKAEAPGSLWKYDAENDELVPKTKEEIEAKDIGTTNDSIKKLVGDLIAGTEGVVVQGSGKEDVANHNADMGAHADLFAAVDDKFATKASLEEVDAKIETNNTTIMESVDSKIAAESVKTLEAVDTKVAAVDAKVAAIDSEKILSDVDAKVDAKLAEKADAASVKEISDKVAAVETSVATSAEFYAKKAVEEAYETKIKDLETQIATILEKVNGGNNPDPTPTPGPEPTPDPEPENPSGESKILWSVDFTMPGGEDGVNISNLLTEEQKAMLTDDNIGGVEYDGVNRHVHAYFLGSEETGKVLDEPMEIPFDSDVNQNPAIKAALKEKGFSAGQNDVSSGWYMTDNVFSILAATKPRQFRIAYDSATFSNPE